MEKALSKKMTAKSPDDIEIVNDICQRQKEIWIHVVWKNSLGIDPSWELASDISPIGMEPHVRELLKIKKNRKSLVYKLLNIVKKKVDYCEEVTLLSDEMNEEECMSMTMKPQSIQPVVAEALTKRPMRAARKNIQLNKCFSESDGDEEFDPKKKASKASRKKVKLDPGLKSLHSDKKLEDDNSEAIICSSDDEPDNNAPTNTEFDIQDFQLKTDALICQTLVQNANNCFHINTSSTEQKQPASFSFASMHNAMSSSQADKGSPGNLQFIFADLHTIVDPGTTLKGLQLTEEENGLKRDFMCKVVTRQSKEVKNVDVVYYEHPIQCFLHLKRKLTQIISIKRFYESCFNKITSI